MLEFVSKKKKLMLEGNTIIEYMCKKNIVNE